MKPLVLANLSRCAAVVIAASFGALTLAAQTSPSTQGTTDKPRTDSMSATAQTGSASQLDRSDKKFVEKAAKSNMKEMALSQLAAERATNPQVKQYAQKIVTDHQKASKELMKLAQSKGVMLDAMKGGMEAMHGSMDTMHGSTTTGSTTTGATVAGTTGGTRAGTTTGTDRARADASGGATTASSSMAGSMGSMAMMDDRDYKKLSDETGRDFDERYVDLMVEEHENAVELFEEAAEDAEDAEIRSFASKHVGGLRQHLQDAQSLQQAVAE